jgi:hypothetical protein
MASLLICSDCAHSVLSHDGAGCSSCTCAHTKEAVIESGLQLARQEIAERWSDKFSGAQNTA